MPDRDTPTATPAEVGTAPLDTSGVAPPPPNSLRSGMGFAVGSFGFTSVVGLLSAVFTARVYGLEVIGEYSLVIAPWILLSQLSNIGEQRALTRDLAGLEPRDPRVAALLYPIMAFSVVLTTVVAAPVLLLTIGGLAGPVDRGDLVLPAVAVVAGYVLIENTGWNLDAVFAAFLAGRELFTARVAQVAGFPLLAVALYPVSPTVGSLTAATILSFVLSCTVRMVLVRRYLRFRPSRPELRDGLRQLPTMLSFGVRLLPSRLAGAATSQAGIWILGITSPIRVVGAYARASSVAVRLNDAGFRIGEILFPALLRRYRDGDVAGFSRVLEDTVRLTSFGLVLLAAPAAGAAGGLLDVFGEGFDDAAGALSFLLLTYAVSVTAVVQSQALLAVGRPGVTSWIGVLRAVLAVSLMWPLSQRWQGTGIALALFLTILVSWALQVRLLRHHLSPGAPMRSLRLAATAAAGAAAGYGASTALYRLLGDTLGTFAGVPAGMVAVLVVAVVSGWVRAEERAQALALVQSRLRRARP